MMSPNVRRFLQLAFAAALLVPAGGALAQFDEEFDDDFAAEEEAPAGGEAEGGDGFDEEFDDDAFPVMTDEEGELVTAEDADSTDVDGPEDPAGEQTTAEGAGGDPLEREPEDQRRAAFVPALAGPTGGFRLSDARPGPAGTWRSQLSVGFFKKDGFLRPGDDHDTVNAALSAAWSPIDLLELYLGLRSQAAFNRADFPALVMTLGDLALGAKMGANITPVFSLGGDVRLELPTGNGVGVGLDGVSIGLRAMATADLRARSSAIPLIVRGVLGYTFDRSEGLIDDIEDRRYAALGDDALPRDQETRHLINRVEQFGLQVDRTDFLQLGLGFEAPIDLPRETVLAPILEYRWGIPVNRQGYVCPFVPGDPEADGCLDQEGVGAHPMTLTLGARAKMPNSGVRATLAIDIGMTGRKAEQVVRELAANAPWRLWLGIAYAFDPRDPLKPPPIERERIEEVEVGPELPPMGRVVGQVIERGTSNAVPGAIINFTDREATSLRAAEDGTFTTYRFSPGPVTMLALSPGFAPGQCEAEIPEEGEDVMVTCELARTMVEIEEDRVVILEKIHFALDSAEILEESFPLMQQIADALQANPQIERVEIQGHTDEQGTHEYNAQLSQARAESVMEWLVEHGIAESRLDARGYGETVPLVEESTEEAHARNRRVEFRILERSE